MLLLEFSASAEGVVEVYDELIEIIPYSIANGDPVRDELIIGPV